MSSVVLFSERKRRERSVAFMDSLREDRDKNQSCDTVLIVDNVPFNAHKCVLINASDYFSKMLTGAFVESNKREIVLHVPPGITKDDFQFVLDFIYGARIAFETTSVTALFNAYQLADMFCLEALTNEINEFLDSLKQFENGVEWYLLAKMIGHRAQEDLKSLIFSHLVDDCGCLVPIFNLNRAVHRRLLNNHRVPYELLHDTLLLFKSPFVTLKYGLLIHTYVNQVSLGSILYRVGAVLSWIVSNPNEGRDRHLAILDCVGAEALPAFVRFKMVENMDANSRRLSAELLKIQFQ